VSYAPLVEAVRPLLTPEELRRRPRLLDGLADLGRLFSDLPLRPPVPLGDPGVERARLFEAVWRLLERTARETPLVIVLEDLHWADPATLSLLQYVAHSVGDQRMVVVCTVRPGRLPESLASLFMALRSGHAVTEFAVAPLDPAAVGALLGELLDGQTPRDLLRLLDARARGIPLFVLGLVSMLRPAGRAARRRRAAAGSARWAGPRRP
jgi:predicted ATPase